MHPRLVDWSLFVFVIAEFLSGYYSFTVGKPSGAWFFWLHGILGLAIVLLLFWKLRRVWTRLFKRRQWNSGTLVSSITLAFALLTIGSGVVWSVFQWPLGYPNGINLHVVFGTLLALAMVGHMLIRFKPLRRANLGDRRTLGRYALLGGVGAALWSTQQASAQALALPGARRRFTGSREVGSGEGLAFPVTMWMFDNPAPLDLAAWRLRVDGAVEHGFSLAIDDLSELPQRAVVATLDCTGGWHSEQTWRGIAVADLLARAQPSDAARFVSFVSSTGYRWSYPLAEARGLMLATHVGEDALDHGRGAPLRLVAPGRRGFQWVKWVVEVKVLERADPGQWGAIFGVPI